jgi:hypothetical protein
MVFREAFTSDIFIKILNRSNMSTTYHFNTLQLNAGQEVDPTGLLIVSAGVENINDIKTDLQQALNKYKKRISSLSS